MKWSYLFKHWISTLILAPLLYFIYVWISENLSFFTLFSSYHTDFLLFIILGIYYSIPTTVIYVIIFYVLFKRKIPVRIAKSILIITTLIGILWTFYFLLEDFIFNIESSVFVLQISYILVALGTGLFYSYSKNIIEKTDDK